MLLPRLLKATGGGSVIQSAVWNPSDKNASLSLSAGDTVATHGGADIVWRTLRSVTSHASGKWYYEITASTDVGNADGAIVGVATSAASTANGSYLGIDTGGWAYYSANGNKYNNAVGAAYGNTWVTGNKIGVAVDIDAGKLWFSKNGTWQASGDPPAGTNQAFTGVTGTLFVAASIIDNGAITTLAPGAFTYPAPSGFSAW